MKLTTTIALVVIILIGGIAYGIQRHVVWQRDSTYLMWSDDRAYLFSNRLNDGWSGNLFEFAWQSARGALGLATELTRRAEWLEVIELTPEGLPRTIVPHASVSPIVSEGHIYAVVQGSLSRWENGAFHVVPIEQVPLIQRAAQGGEFTNSQGWSSLYDINNRGEGERSFQLETGGATAVITVKQSATRREMWVEFPGKQRQLLVDLPTGPVWVDEATYAAQFQLPPK